MIMELMGYKYKKPYSHYGNSIRKREREKESVFKAIMAENFPNIGREIDIQNQEAHWTPNRLNLNRTIP